MKKRIVIPLVILLIVFLALGWVAYKNWNSIEAFVFALQNTQEDVENEMRRSKEALDKYINENENLNVRELTEEETKALANGEISEEEALEIITGKKEESSQSNKDGKDESKQTQKNQSQNEQSKPVKKPDNTTPELTDAEIDEMIEQEIAKLYVLKSQYLGKLDAIEEAAWAERRKIPKEERDAHKQRVIRENMTRISAWETECDGIVYGIIDNIRQILKKYGRDQAILDEIKQAYLSEKRMKKSYYINRYMD